MSRDECRVGTFSGVRCTNGPEEKIPELPPERRSRKARRTRDTLAQAAFELVLDRGLRYVTVEEIAEAARRRPPHLQPVLREQGSRRPRLPARRRRPDQRGPAVPPGRGAPARRLPARRPRLARRPRRREPWHRRPRIFDLLVVAEEEPTLYAAFHHIRVDAQEDSVAILADRLGVDPRPTSVRPSRCGRRGRTLAAQATWVRGGPDALPALVGRGVRRPGGGPARGTEAPPGRDAAQNHGRKGNIMTTPLTTRTTSTSPTTPSAEFAGRTALITGGASGIGLAVARLLTAAGAAVVVADYDEANARKAAAQLESAGAQAAAVRMDVTDPASVEAGVQSPSRPSAPSTSP